MSKIKIILLSFLLISLFFACKTKTPVYSDKMPMPVMQFDTTLKKEIQTLEADKTEKTLQKNDTIDYFNKNHFRYCNYIYNNNIKTVLFHRTGWELSSPVLDLNKNETLTLSFDDLDGDFKKYQYTIVHCDADWKPSDLNKNDYIKGFTTAYLEQAFSSVNTLQAYTHYKLTYPQENVCPLLTGNYILNVFIENPDNPVITRRFLVFDSKVNINATIRQATLLEDKKYKQEIIFSVNYGAYQILNPFQNVKIILLQNERWDNAITTLKPSIVRNNELVYDYEYGNVFQGDNEFRAIDLKSLKYLTGNIENIQQRSKAYHVFMKTDERRSFKKYITQSDINGRFAIKSDDVRNSSTDAEYCHVYFYLPYQAPLIHGSVYVFGALTDWSFNENNKMVYNYATKTYERALYLKQGYYNYQYAFLENGKTVGDLSFIEGTHSHTENDYTILVYYREPNDNYDRLIGIKYLNSTRQ